MSKQALGEIKEGVKKAHSLGDGSRFPIEVTFPQNITDVSFTPRAILVTTNFFGVSSTEVIEFDSNISGNLTISEGLHRIIVENVGGEVVLSEI